MILEESSLLESKNSISKQIDGYLNPTKLLSIQWATKLNICICLSCKKNIQ